MCVSKQISFAVVRNIASNCGSLLLAFAEKPEKTASTFHYCAFFNISRESLYQTEVKTSKMHGTIKSLFSHFVASPKFF